MFESASRGMRRDRMRLAMRRRTKAFSETRGRRPRVLVSRFQAVASSHEVERIASLLADLGFDVDINPSVQQADQVARMAMENDVHVVVVPGTTSCENGLYLKELANLLESPDHNRILLAVCNRGSDPQDFLDKEDVNRVLNLKAFNENAARRLLDEIERFG